MWPFRRPTAGDDPAVAARISAALPHSISSELTAALKRIPAATIPPTQDSIGPVFVLGEQLRIPKRIYSDPPGMLSGMTSSETQKAIVDCLYTRHHDGYVRQRFLRKAIQFSEPWVVPFVIQLLGEYVIEILQDVWNGVSRLKIKAYSDFVEENPQFMELTRYRIVSYWDVYYRREIPKICDYVGWRILDELGWWSGTQARRLCSRQ